MDDSNRDREHPATAEKDEKGAFSRRKLVYAAPLLMSRKLFYRASGCGKTNPLQRSCVGGAAVGS